MTKLSGTLEKELEKVSENVSAKHVEQVAVDKRAYWEGPDPRTKWDVSSSIMFLHIGKSGGTSFDSAATEWLNKNSLPLSYN